MISYRFNYTKSFDDIPTNKRSDLAFNKEDVLKDKLTELIAALPEL